MIPKIRDVHRHHIAHSNRLKAAHRRTKSDWYRARQLKKLKKSRTGFP